MRNGFAAESRRPASTDEAVQKYGEDGRSAADKESAAKPKRNYSQRFLLKYQRVKSTDVTIKPIASG